MGRLIIDGNKVYEIDEKCMERKKEKKNNEENKRKRGGNRKYRQKLKKARNHKAPGFLVPAKTFTEGFGHAQKQPQPFPLLPQQKSNRIIHKQLLLPQPLSLKVLPHPPQQANKIINQIMELHPPSSLHPHPQFVAAKSLILNSSILHLQYNSMPSGLALLHCVF